MYKVEIGQEHVRSSYRAFKFKNIMKSKAPEFELLAATRTQVASVPHVHLTREPSRTLSMAL